MCGLGCLGPRHEGAITAVEGGTDGGDLRGHTWGGEQVCSGLSRGPTCSVMGRRVETLLDGVLDAPTFDARATMKNTLKPSELKSNEFLYF